MSITIEELCFGCPREFHKYMKYCKNLKFEEEPDYNYLRKLIKDIADRENIDLFDGMYDWCIKAITI